MGNFNPCRENKRPEKRNTRKALVSYLGRVQLSSVRAEEEGAEEHYLKQKWRQNPPVRSILLPPPPPPAPLPHRGRREPSGVPATRGSRHRASPAQVGKRPFFTKKKNKGSRTETATTLPLSGQPPRSSAKVTRRGKLDPQRPSPSWAPGRGGSEERRGGRCRSVPTASLGPKEPRSRQPSCAGTGKGDQSCPSSGKRD